MEFNAVEITKQYMTLIDKILYHYAGDAFKDEVRVAKGEFFDNAGILDEKAPNYELRMAQFFDWYFFTRELKGYSQTPLDVALLARELRFDAEDLPLINQMKLHRHSLFEFLKLKGNDIYIKDLFKGDTLVVRSSLWIYGFDSDEVFEARLIPIENSWIFAKGFCFHPIDARKYILSEIQRLKKNPDLNPEDVMVKLVKMRYRFERYRHVKVDLIYSNDSKLG